MKHKGCTRSMWLWFPVISVVLAGTALALYTTILQPEIIRGITGTSPTFVCTDRSWGNHVQTYFLQSTTTVKVYAATGNCGIVFVLLKPLTPKPEPGDIQKLTRPLSMNSFQIDLRSMGGPFLLTTDLPINPSSTLYEKVETDSCTCLLIRYAKPGQIRPGNAAFITVSF